MHDAWRTNAHVQPGARLSYHFVPFSRCGEDALEQASFIRILRLWALVHNISAPLISDLTYRKDKSVGPIERQGPQSPLYLQFNNNGRVPHSIIRSLCQRKALGCMWSTELICLFRGGDQKDLPASKNRWFEPTEITVNSYKSIAFLFFFFKKKGGPGRWVSS